MLGNNCCCYECFCWLSFGEWFMVFMRETPKTMAFLPAGAVRRSACVTSVPSTSPPEA